MSHPIPTSPDDGAVPPTDSEIDDETPLSGDAPVPPASPSFATPPPEAPDEQ